MKEQQDEENVVTVKGVKGGVGGRSHILIPLAMSISMLLATSLDNLKSQGDFAFRCDPQGYPQLILSNGSIELYRIGPWNGLGFNGRPNLKPNSISTYGLIFTKEEVFYGYELINNSVVSRFSLSHNGIMQRFTWIDRTQEWVLYLTTPTDNCDYYKRCGPYGSCNIENIPVCGCLSNFVPKYPKEWENGDWPDGCVRRTPLDCHNGDGFLKYSHYKMPDTRYSWFNRSMTLRECEMVCLKNCSCTAYTNLDIRGGGSGCLLRFDELIDMREFSENGQDIYIRIASPELVYMGVHSHGLEDAEATVTKVKDSHCQFLASFLGSSEQAKETIFYSYSRDINGFAATLEDEEAAAIASTYKHYKLLMMTTR
ncbi:unnamed protein product [Camellia sinensis]